MITPYNCIVVANGSFPVGRIPQELLSKASVIIACDGAAESLHQRGLTPSYIVGDLDSIPDTLRQTYADRIHHIEDQEINDLTKAINFAHDKGFQEVLILGATGLREDHTLGNISLLMDYAPRFKQIEMLSDYGLFTPLLHTTTLQSQPGQQVSIFNLYPEGEISTDQLRWALHKRKLTAWWQGTLNEAMNTEFTITLSEAARVIIYRQLMEQNL